MFRILDTRPHWTCAGTTRRELLRVGALSLGGLALPDLLAARAAVAREKKVVRDRSVVLLFLQGGPSHIELFDPKMTAPDGVRSITSLGVRALAIGPEIDPGVPWTVAAGEPRRLLALKSGNFGSPDFFAKALEMLR